VAAKGASLEALRRQGAVRSPLASGVLFGDYRVRTQSGKVNLIDALPTGPALEVPLPTPGGSGPLWLFSNSTEKSQASVWSGRGLGERTWVLAHPDAVPDLVQGQAVVVESALGSVEAELRLDARQRSDVCVMPKGGHFDRGQSANALIPARATDLGLGAAYLDVLVRIRPAAAQKPAK